MKILFQCPPLAMIYLIQRLPLVKSTNPHHLRTYKYSTHNDIHHLPHPHTKQTARQLGIHQPLSQSTLNPKVHYPFISLPILPGGILTVITDPQQCQPL